MTRRDLLLLAAQAGGLSWRGKELHVDIAVIGGGVGGCAAALAAARNGWRVLLAEETDWIGGQLTSQAVPPDEHPWIESFGATRAYREYRDRVRAWYRRNYPLTEAAREQQYLNPGGGGVSRITHEPRVSLAVLESMLAPFSSGGRLLVLTGHQAVAADGERDRVRSVSLKNLETGGVLTIHASCFLDATELGDLLPLTRTEYVTGSESRAETGEPHAPERPRPANMQAFTYCFAMDYLAGEDHTIDKPAEYGFWRDYLPQMHPPWPGKLLSWVMSDPQKLTPREVFFDPTLAARKPGLNLWLYRRIASRANFTPGAYDSDITLVNWPQNDYWLGNLCEVPETDATRHRRRARQLSLSLLYWMQTEAPRPDGGTGWPGLRLRRDIVGTGDGLAKYPYVRESRRIRAEFTILEQHVGTEARAAAPAQEFPDSVGVGSYRIDLHPSSGGDNYIDISSMPFQIPAGALIPRRVENLLAACKNLGVTHITNGCYRLHPVEWNIGEAAGMLAGEALRLHTTPRAIRNTDRLRRDFQARLTTQGIEIAWPRLSAL